MSRRRVDLPQPLGPMRTVVFPGSNLREIEDSAVVESKRKDIEILKFNISYEGRDLLTPHIIREVSTIPAERLVEHGFEIAFRRIR